MYIYECKESRVVPAKSTKAERFRPASSAVRRRGDWAERPSRLHQPSRPAHRPVGHPWEKSSPLPIGSDLTAGGEEQQHPEGEKSVSRPGRIQLLHEQRPLNSHLPGRDRCEDLG